MLEIILYFGVAYLLIALIIAIGVKWIRLSALLRKHCLLGWVMLMGVLALPFLPYLTVDVQTAMHRDELEPAVRQAIALIDATAEVQDTKVMSIDRRSANVLVTYRATYGYRAADLVRVSRVHGRWCFRGDYTTIWSEGGSADGNTFPPYPN